MTRSASCISTWHDGWARWLAADRSPLRRRRVMHRRPPARRRSPRSNAPCDARHVRGRQLLPLPDATFLRVRMGGQPGDDRAYTLVLNKDYSNLTSMLEDEDTRNPGQRHADRGARIRGELPEFLPDGGRRATSMPSPSALPAIRNRDDYERFVALYGVRRTNPGFWSDADWFQAAYRRLEPVDAGIFDLNRYRNR